MLSSGIQKASMTGLLAGGFPADLGGRELPKEKKSLLSIARCSINVRLTDISSS
jgi:hypothetical protein